jgi:hypothetical protein
MPYQAIEYRLITSTTKRLAELDMVLAAGSAEKAFSFIRQVPSDVVNTVDSKGEEDGALTEIRKGDT